MDENRSFDLVLLMNLLSEFIYRFKNSNEIFLKDKIVNLINQFELHRDDLNEEDFRTFEVVKNDFEESVRQREQILTGDSILNHSRNDRLIKSFKKFRGLVFDIKTRFEYSGPQVAIQDGLDITEYFKEVIEEVNNDLKESHLFSLPKETREHGEKVLDNLSVLYSSFKRERMKELYPLMIETLKSYAELISSEE